MLIKACKKMVSFSEVGRELDLPDFIPGFREQC